MTSLVIYGDTSGAITLAANATAGTNTLTLPASTGVLLANTTVGVCRGWVNFNGSGAATIRASYNVSSVTYNGTGSYTINWTVPMADSNSAVILQASTNPGTANNYLAVLNSQNTTTATFYTYRADTNTQADLPILCCAIFR